MALGLNGHLTSLTAFNTFEYLQNKHELTVIALLLGISAARLVTPYKKEYSVYIQET